MKRFVLMAVMVFVLGISSMADALIYHADLTYTGGTRTGYYYSITLDSFKLTTVDSGWNPSMGEEMISLYGPIKYRLFTDTGSLVTSGAGNFNNGYFEYQVWFDLDSGNQLVLSPNFYQSGIILLDGDWADSSTLDPLTTSSLYTTESPVPEPSTLLLFGIGLAGALGARRKFRW